MRILVVNVSSRRNASARQSEGSTSRLACQKAMTSRNLLRAVVDKIPNSSKVQPANEVSTRCFNPGADAGFFYEQGQRSFNVQSNCTGGGRSIFEPPFCSSFNFPLCAGLDADDERQDQPKRRSRANNSSAEIPSSRSASSMASRSAAS